MATTVDPAGVETAALFDAALFSGARVLEIGSGDGRLALRYADVARAVVGLESNANDVAAAKAICPPSSRERVRFVRGTGLKLPFRADTFDVALFGWSL